MEENSLPFRLRHERLGLLVYEPGDRPYSRVHAQMWFLDAARKVEPQILSDLASEPLRVYKEVWPFWLKFPSAFLSSDDDITWQVFCDEVTTFTRNGWNVDLGSLKVSLERWAAQWHLDRVDWIKAAGLRTLAMWHVEPHTQVGWAYGGTPIFEPLSREERRFQLSLDGFDPTLETADEAKRRIRQCFEQRLTDHLEEVNRRIAEAGFVLTPTKRGGDDHWTWLAQRVVLGWTPDRIAEEAGNQRPVTPAEESVREAVTKAAEFAGLPLPKGKPGRRPKGQADRKR